MTIKHWKFSKFKMDLKNTELSTCKPGDILLLIRDPDHRTMSILHLDPPPLNIKIVDNLQHKFYIDIKIFSA